MIWRRATLLLIGACVVMCALIYVRDRTAPGPNQSERAQAQADASRVLNLMAPAGSCRSRCTAAAPRRTASDTWLTELSTPSWRQCFLIDLAAFGSSSQHGVAGLRGAPCPSAE